MQNGILLIKLKVTLLFCVVCCNDYGIKLLEKLRKFGRESPKLVLEAVEDY